MDIEDFVEPEIAVTAAVTAALFSPRARKFLRKGLVYGTAGALAAGDVITLFDKKREQPCPACGSSSSKRGAGDGQPGA